MEEKSMTPEEIRLLLDEETADCNQAQKEAIEAPVSKNVLISAGAGSGKTKTLTSKVYTILKTRAIKPSELLVMTFTNAAAHEMKERIMKRFEGDELYDQVSSAHVQTFDSFNQFLVSQYASALGISPNISIMDDRIASSMKEELLSEILNEYYSDEEKREKILKTLIKFDLKDDKGTRSLIMNVYSFLEKMTLKDAEDFKEHYEKRFLNRAYFDKKSDELYEYYKRFLGNILWDKSLREKLEECDYTSMPGPDFYTLPTDKLPISAADWKIEQEKINKLLAMPKEEFFKEASKVDLFPKPEKGNNKPFTEKRNIVKPILHEVGLYADLDEEYERYISFKDDVELILDIALDLRKRLIAYKKATNSFTFQDITEMAVTLLTDSEYEEIAQEIRNRFKYIMVDEYQDTNDFQEAFLNSLTAPKEDGSHSSLFCVGDAKQSIYGFRNSKVELFVNRANKYRNSDDGELIGMNINYRSRKGVLDDINYIFMQYMSLEHGGIDYTDIMERLVPGSAKPNYENYGIHRIHSVSEIGSDGLKPKEWEAKAIAYDIKKKIKDGHLVYDRSIKGPNKERPCSYKDFAIISRVKSSFSLYADTFKANGIPYNLTESEDMAEAEAIALVKSLLGLCLYDKGQRDLDYKHLFMSIARSYIYSMKDNDIDKIINNADGRSPKEKIKESQIYKDIHSFNEQYDGLPLSIYFSDLLKEFKVIEKLYLLGGTSATIGKLDSFFSMLLNEQKRGSSLSDFLNLLNNSSSVKLESKSAIKLPDAVDIMTIHGSKGLERKIVYMAVNDNHSGKGDNILPSEPMSVDNGIMLRDYRILPSEKDPDDDKRIIYPATPLKKIPHLTFEKASKEANANYDEHIRLIYVLLTRAENELYIVGDPLSGNDSYLKKDHDKWNPYGMLSYITHYPVMDEKTVQTYLGNGILKQEDLDNLERYENILKDLKLPDGYYSLPLEAKERCYYLFEETYKKALYEKINSLLADFENKVLKEERKEALEKINKMDDDGLAHLYAFYYYAKTDIHSASELISYVKSLSDDDEDDEEESPKNEFDCIGELASFKEALLTKDSKKTKLKAKVISFMKYGITSFYHISFKTEAYADRNEAYSLSDLSSLRSNTDKSFDLRKEESRYNVSNEEIVFPKFEKKRASSRLTTILDDNIQRLFDYGTHMHALLEMTDLKSKDTSFIEDERDKELIDKVLKLDVFDDLNNADLYQEYPYYDEEYETSGYIDLLIVKDGIYKIIDYKSSNLEKEEYQDQLRTYRRNIKRIFGVDESKIEMYLLSIAKGELKELNYEEGEIYVQESSKA